MWHSLSVLTGGDQMHLHRGNMTPCSKPEALRGKVLPLWNSADRYASAIHNCAIRMMPLCVNDIWTKHWINAGLSLKPAGWLQLQADYVFPSSPPPACLLPAWPDSGLNMTFLYLISIFAYVTEQTHLGFTTRPKDVQLTEEKRERRTLWVCENETPGIERGILRGVPHRLMWVQMQCSPTVYLDKHDDINASTLPYVSRCCQRWWQLNNPNTRCKMCHLSQQSSDFLNPMNWFPNNTQSMRISCLFPCQLGMRRRQQHTHGGNQVVKWWTFRPFISSCMSCLQTAVNLRP